MRLKIGDRVKSKKNPELKGTIVDIIDDLYILDWGGRYFYEELELI